MKSISLLSVFLILCFIGYVLIDSEENNVIPQNFVELPLFKTTSVDEVVPDGQEPENIGAANTATTEFTETKPVKFVLNDNSGEDVDVKFYEEFRDAELRFLKESIDYNWSYNIETNFSNFVSRHPSKDKMTYELACRQTMCELTLFEPDFELWNEVFDELKISEQVTWSWRYTYLNVESNTPLIMILEK